MSLLQMLVYSDDAFNTQHDSANVCCFEALFAVCQLLTQQPPYLVNLLHFSDIYRTIRSSASKPRFVHKTNLNIGKRAFSVAAPSIWNQLPIMIKSS